MLDLVSIIIPVYNVFKFLPYCVESLKRQTYERLEIILINDGSTDGCSDLCNQIQKTDNRIVVYHKKNGGVSSARNYGIEKANGNYVMFVDGDDWIEPNGVEMLVEKLKECNSDACYCNKYYKNLYDVRISTSVSSNTIYPASKILKLHMHYGFVASPCLSLIRKDIMKSVRFRDDVHTLEDWEFNFQILCEVKNIAILDEAFYHYRSVDGSASKSPLNKRKLSCFKIIESVNKTIKDKNLPLKGEVYNIPSFLIYHMLVVYSNNGEQNGAGKQLIKYVRKYAFRIILSSQIEFKHKLYTMLSCFSLKIFKCLYLLKNKKL